MEMTWAQWKAMKKDLRRRFSGTGWTLLVYYLILNASVFLWMIVEILWKMLLQLGRRDFDQMEQIVNNAAASGWGYFLSAGVGILILLLWKKPRYFNEEIFSRGKISALRQSFCR